MEAYEKYFVNTPLRWGKSVADPREWPPDEWKTWTSRGFSYAGARFIDGPRAATEIVFTPDVVLWKHWHETSTSAGKRPWARNHGMWNKDRFLKLVRIYHRNLGPNAPPFDGPQLASLAHDLMKSYMVAIGYEPFLTGPEAEVVPLQIRILLDRR